MAERYFGVLHVDPEISHFEIVQGRKWFGLATNHERWAYEFDPEAELPGDIAKAQVAADTDQTNTMFEATIVATCAERGSFGPSGWCCRKIIIHAIPVIHRHISHTPGPLFRKWFGLPPAKD